MPAPDLAVVSAARSAEVEAPAAALLTGYQRKLLLFLSVATFFEGYDFIALSQILPNLRSEFGLAQEWSGYLVGVAHRRGLVMGLLQGINGLGSIACAILVPALVQVPGLGWRAVYLVAVVPLVLLAYARRGLRETRRFETQATPERARPFGHLWSTPYRGRALLLGAIWFLSYIAAQNAIALWKEHAVHGLGFTDAEVGLAVGVAAGVSMPLVFGVGKLIDGLGRRPGAAIVYAIGAAGTYLCFTVQGFWPVTAALVLGIFGAQAYLPVLTAYDSELFPTDLRSDAFAWCNNVVGRVAYVGAPLAVGGIVGATGLGYGPVIASTAVFPLAAAAIVYASLPETRNRELEDTAALPAAPDPKGRER